MAKSMIHWNHHQLCVIDTETTGLDPYFHELIQICILPVDSNIQPLKVDGKGVTPFYINIRPEHPERIDPQAMKVNQLTFTDLARTGKDRLAAIDMLEHWINEKLNLGATKYGTPKKIMPLGQNYAFDKAFIQRWLSPALYDEYFHYHYRDTMIAANFLNDHAAFHAEKVPFSKCNLTWLAKELKVPYDRAHDALQDCLATAEVYRRLCRRSFGV